MPGMTFGQMFAALPITGGFGYTEVTATAEMKELTAIGFNGKIGVAYKVNEELSMGLVMHTSHKPHLQNGKASMDMTAQLNDAFGKSCCGTMQQNPGKTPAEASRSGSSIGGMGIDLSKGVLASYDLSVDLNFPQTIGFGVAYKATPKLNSADFEWVNWEKAFDKMTIKLTNGTNSNINTMLGNTGAFDLEFPMNWKNSFVIKVGGEYKFSDKFEARLSYAYGSKSRSGNHSFPCFPCNC
ncbi:MAG: outer membrane protein transport protein [Ignavibacteriales bacterium]|nr:outer membrane protein transport protein [Ignavibacteriales bacterium]